LSAAAIGLGGDAVKRQLRVQAGLLAVCVVLRALLVLCALFELRALQPTARIPAPGEAALALQRVSAAAILQQSARM